MHEDYLEAGRERAKSEKRFVMEPRAQRSAYSARVTAWCGLDATRQGGAGTVQQPSPLERRG